MRARTALLAAVVLAATSATPALAAKKPPAIKYCNLLVDVKGDGTWHGLSSDNIDIVSADIATGPKEFVAVLRMAAPLKFEGDNLSQLGYIWRLGASGNGIRYSFEARRGIGPSPKLIGTASVGDISPQGLTTEIVGNAIVWKFPRAGIAPLARPGIKWGDFGANTNVMSNSADGASSEKKYPDRGLSCVVAK